jgi:UDP-N-acetylglucosamine 2-epimerase (non-hydrolysing)
MITFACIVGARPNFMKMAPILRALDAHPDVRAVLIHTGQHYDANLSQVFFDELGIKRPDFSLEVGSGKHGAQTAKLIERCEELFEKGPPDGGAYDRLIVVGDVNSTVGAAIAAVKLGIPVAHVEAGLRSFDRSMPEEINRILTDSISDMLFVSEPAGMENLRKEGHPESHLHLVGNVMIDTLVRLLPMARERDVLSQFGIEGDFGLVTLHRPANVDVLENLDRLLEVLIETAREIPLAFPMHPRTKAQIERYGLGGKLDTNGVKILPPLGYIDFLSLTSRAKVVVTDSGGIQEETTMLGVPCLTLRPNTERPATIDYGTNLLIGNDLDQVVTYVRSVKGGEFKKGQTPPFWDGRAAERIAAILVESPGSMW